MNTNMTEQEIKRSEERLDNWIRIKSDDKIDDRIVEIARKHIDVTEVCEAMLNIVATEYLRVDDNAESAIAKVTSIMAEAMSEAEGKKDLFAHHLFYLWLMDKDYFEDNEDIFEDITNELL